MKNRGFTLVEMLVVLVILGLLVVIGIFTVNNIQKNAEENYYRSMESTLKIAGNDYFNDNREDLPIDDYNVVKIDRLIEHNYIEQLKTYDKKENCNPESGVYIYNTDTGNEYEVCLICGEYKSPGEYCNAKKKGQILITGVTDKGEYYNPVLSYTGTAWKNASSITVTFELMGDEKPTHFTVYNGVNNSEVFKCSDVKNNKCSRTMSVTGNYYVVAYNGSEKVGNRKYFNIKIDNTSPTFDIKDTEEEKDLTDKEIEHEYENEVINLHDDNGYRSVTFSLIEVDVANPRIDIKDKDLLESNLRILEHLPSGKYKLTIKVIDYANNQTEKSYTFTVKYNVDLVYFDNKEKKYDVGRIQVYTNGTYKDLPETVKVGGKEKSVEWYDNTNFTGDKYYKTTLVKYDSYHILYGREARKKVAAADEPKCNNNGDFTYNGAEQTLIVAKEGYQLSGTKGTDAKSYTFIAKLDDNYTWSDGTRVYKQVTCTIKPYRVEFNPNTNPCVKGLVYNGIKQKLTETSECTSSTGDWWIGCIPGTDIDYDPIAAHGAEFGPPLASAAGEHVVTYRLTNSNFVWADGSTGEKKYTCKIDTYKQEVPKDVCVSGLVYNGEEQELVKEKYLNPPRLLDQEAPYAINGRTQKIPGDHIVTFSLNNVGNINFEWEGGGTEDKTFTCSIDKYTLPDSFNYTNDNCKDPPPVTDMSKVQSLFEPRPPGAEPTGIVTLEINGKKAHVILISNYMIKHAGTYTITFKLRVPDYYKWADGTTDPKKIQCKMDPKAATVSWDEDTLSFEYDGKEHAPTAKKYSVYDAAGSKFSVDFDVTSFKEVGKHTATATCKATSELLPCSDFSFSNNTIEFEIVDTTKPTCSLTVSSAGTITASPNDNYKLSYYGFDSSYSGSSTKTKTVTSGGTYTYYVKDTSGNTNSCSITVTKTTQSRTSTCSSGNRCYSAGCYEKYKSCRDSSCGCEDDGWSSWSAFDKCTHVDNESDDYTACQVCTNGKFACKTRTCNKYKSCENDNCSCKTYNRSISSCGCATWGDYTDWANATSCTEGESSDHSTTTQCRNIYS